MNKYRIALLALLVAAATSIRTSATEPPQRGGPPLFAVEHDATLKGDGSSAAPLGITASPTVSGSLTVNGDIKANAFAGQSLTVDDTIIADFVNAKAITVDARGTSFTSAIRSIAGDFSQAVEAIGGLSTNALRGGSGVRAIGGASANGTGGDAVRAEGGRGINGGPALRAVGGESLQAPGAGGEGVLAVGGFASSGNGGIGVSARGGQGIGSGNFGGTGIIAFAGQGILGASNGLAGAFDGNVVITGNLSKGGGAFKIDHPLDPANKYLYHSFVESPDMMNIYNGNTITDSNGDALIQLPEYFDALNRDFRYQLTVIGTFAQSIVSEKIQDNHFRIKTNLPNVEVSWQVTGVRQDAYANKNRIPVEVEKSEQERGLYLHPDAFNQPREKSILMAHQPETKNEVKGVPKKTIEGKTIVKAIQH